MAIFNPIQEAFNSGEISKRLHGHFSSPIYRRALYSCKDFVPTPHGSLLMRSGTKDRGLFADVLRVIPFNAVGGSAYSVLLSSSAASGYMRILDSNGNIAPLYNNLVNNGSFHSGLIQGISSGTGWGDDVATPAGSVSPRWDAGGFAHFVNGQWMQQRIVLQGGAAYTLRFRAKSPDSGTASVYVRRTGAGAFALAEVNPVLTPSWQNFEYKFTCPIGDSYYLSIAAPSVTTADYDDVVLTADADLGGWDGTGADQKIVTPWKTADIPLVQFDQDNAKNMMVLTGPAGLKVLTLTSHGLWFLRNAPWVNKPAEWVSGNYPATVELGYQGRLWLAGAPDQPNTFKASKSGSPFDFTTGANPADSMSWNASLRGAINWIRGHLSLLIGSENSEQSANGNGALIAPTNPPDVRDESVFGSTKMQVAMAGDEVLFVGKDKSTIRALSFDAQTKNGWVTSPVSFVSEHLVRGVRELHFAYTPDPTIIAIKDDGKLIACTYKRDPQAPVIAWFQTSLVVASAAVLDTVSGSVIRLIVERADGKHIEDLSLHEVGVDYLDSWASAVADANGTISGLNKFEGQAISVKYADDDGRILVASRDVVGGTVTVEDAAGQTVVTGLPYVAEAVTLPLPLRDKKGRFSKIGVLLSDSALPKLNGWIPQNDKLAEAPQGLPQELRSGKFSASNEGTDDEAKITITQDLPYRTEILALYGVAEG